MRALTLALPLMMACASPGDPPLRVPAPQRVDAPAVESAQDSVIQVRVGEEFVIALQANPSTGHRWMLADSLDRIVRLQAQAYVAQQPVMPGSGGHERLTFVGVAAGETTIRLRYQRPVQRSAPRLAEFRVRINPAAP
jgi:predicted secreted protein